MLSTAGAAREIDNSRAGQRFNVCGSRPVASSPSKHDTLGPLPRVQGSVAQPVPPTQPQATAELVVACSWASQSLQLAL